MSDFDISRQTTVSQPTIFIPHGAGPCFFMNWEPVDTWEGMRKFLENIPDTLPEKPRAILLVSAHWLSDDFAVTYNKNSELIFDYYGFPKETYELTYPATGNQELAERIYTLLRRSGLKTELQSQRGYDHGVFVPLKVMLPEADVPVVQLSLRSDLNPSVHIAAGHALKSLRDEGVLIIGSGMSFHNMPAFNNPIFTSPSRVFDDWLTNTVEADPKKRIDNLRQWHLAPYAHDCHPLNKEEHLMPLMFVTGAAGDDVGRKVFSELIMDTQLSAFRYG